MARGHHPVCVSFYIFSYTIILRTEYQEQMNHSLVKTIEINTDKKEWHLYANEILKHID